MIKKQDVIAGARQTISDVAGTTFAAADLDVFYSGAVQQYNKAKPLQTRGSLTTVSGQAYYDIPTGIVNLLAITDWGTPLKSQVLRDFFSPVPPAYVDPKTFYQYDEALAGAFWTGMANVGDLWKPLMTIEWVVDPAILGAASPKYMLRIDPMPLSSGATVSFIYTVAHAPDALGNYPSIPDLDIDIVSDLMTADLLDAIAIDLSKQGVVKAGDSMIDTTNSSKDLRTQATSSRRRAYGQMEADVSMRRV